MYRRVKCCAVATLLLTLSHGSISHAAPFPTPFPALHPQFGGIGGMAAGKILQKFNLPGSPNDLFAFLLEYALKQRIGNTLPLKLNAGDAYPTIENSQLPGGAFEGKPLSMTAGRLGAPLPPGDYIAPVMAFCTQYSVHRAGQGTAYTLAPVEGTQAETIATLLWRGMLAGKSPQELQATNWAIQSGVTYGSMPKPYQALVDELIPDYRDKLKGNMLDLVQTTYKDVTTDPRRFLQEYIKERYNTTVPIMLLPKLTVPAPPLNAVLAKMGPAGQMVLDAQKQSDIFLTAYTTKELGEQKLFAGQGEQLPAQPAVEGPWTVRVPGTAYLRFVVKSGNMHGDNLVQIRILPGTSIAAVESQPHLVLAAYQATPSPAAASPSGPPATSVYGLLGVKTVGNATGSGSVQALTSSGVIGYSVGGGGAQALVPVAIPKPAPCDNAEIVDTFDPDDRSLLAGYHHYVVDTEICLIDSKGCTADAVFTSMISQSNFAAPTSDTSALSQCKKTTVQIPVLGSGTIQTTIDSSKRQIVNYTLADHPLRNGEVIRTVKLDPSAGWVHIVTEGFGDGWLPYLNETNAPSVWGEVDRRLKADVGVTQPPPRRRSKNS